MIIARRHDNGDAAALGAGLTVPPGDEREAFPGGKAPACP